MHTVFFGENDYSHNESLSKASPQELATCDDERRDNTMNIPINAALEDKVSEKSSVDMEKNLQASSDSEDEDGIVTDLSDAGEDNSETHKSVITLEKAIKSSDEEPEQAGDEMNQETLDCLPQSTQVERTCKQDNTKTDGEFNKRISTLEKPKMTIDTELIKDDDDRSAK